MIGQTGQWIFIPATPLANGQQQVVPVSNPAVIENVQAPPAPAPAPAPAESPTPVQPPVQPVAPATPPVAPQAVETPAVTAQPAPPAVVLGTPAAPAVRPLAESDLAGMTVAQVVARWPEVEALINS